MVRKENDVNREKHIQSAIMGDMQRELQQSSELRLQIDNLKDIIGSLQRDIRTLNEVISEQKVSRRRVDFIGFACNNFFTMDKKRQPFLPRDAMTALTMPSPDVRPFVRLSVTRRY